jgi:hypothetical protein
LTCSSARCDVVNEMEWLSCTDVGELLDAVYGLASERKAHLYACACCRRVAHLFPDERIIHPVEAAEYYADGRMSVGELHEACNRAFDVGSTAGTAASNLCLPQFWTTDDCKQVASMTRCAVAERSGDPDAAARSEEKCQAGILRDLFGNPFHRITVDPAWLQWNESAVVKLAQVIYDECRFHELPVLADALEDAGCDNAVILSHCRGGGPHVRGCWIVDLFLGKG